MQLACLELTQGFDDLPLSRGPLNNFLGWIDPNYAYLDEEECQEKKEAIKAVRPCSLVLDVRGDYAKPSASR